MAETKYNYKDENNITLFTKVRVEPGVDGRSKSFYYEREENGQIVRNLEGCRRVYTSCLCLSVGFQKV